MSGDEFFREVDRADSRKLVRPASSGSWGECRELRQAGLRFFAPRVTYCLVYVGGQYHGSFNDELYREVTKAGAQAGIRLVYVRVSGKIRCGVPARDLRLVHGRGLGFATEMEIEVANPEVFYDKVMHGADRLTGRDLSNEIRTRMRQLLYDEFRDRSATEVYEARYEDLQNEIVEILNDSSKDNSLSNLGISVRGMMILQRKVL
ncbi:MAG: hypothetical protein ACTSVT_09400 [Candidatus Thorarchaeota archaeon]